MCLDVLERARKGAEIRRDRRAQHDLFAARRDAQLGRVQQRAIARAPSVERVAGDRGAARREVDAELMRAAAERLARDARAIAARRDHGEARMTLAEARRRLASQPESKAFGVCHTSDESSHLPLGLHRRRRDDCEVSLRDSAFLEGASERRGRLTRLREKHDAAGLAIEPVHCGE